MVKRILARDLPIISERSRKLGKISDASRNVNVATVFKIVQKRQRTVSLSAALLSLGKS